MGGATPLDPSASWVSRMLSRSPASRGRGAKAGDDRRDSERRSAGLSCFAEDERIRAAASLDINNTSGWELVRSTKEEIIVGDRLERTKGGVDMGAEQSINQDDHYGTAVQFSTGVYYCKEDEGRMTVDVLRIGDCSGQASVAYRTVDGSATAGIHYEAAAGVVLFNSGQTVAHVHVEIIDSTCWNPTLEFGIVLENPEQARLSLSNTQCRVWIIDMDSFPSSNVTDDSTRFELLFEFFLRCWQNDFVRRGSIKSLLIDQFSNLIALWQLLISVYLVDQVLTQPPSAHTGDGRLMKLSVQFGLAHALPVMLANWLQRQKPWFGVGGALRKELQVNLLRKYLNYAEASRKKIGTAGFIQALNRDVIEVIDNGYLHLFTLVRSASHICILLVWISLRSPIIAPFLLLDRKSVV